jgi:hypothetical protein
MIDSTTLGVHSLYEYNTYVKISKVISRQGKREKFNPY